MLLDDAMGDPQACYDSPPDGTPLTGAPATPSVEISLPSGATEQSFNFCVEQITLTTQ